MQVTVPPVKRQVLAAGCSRAGDREPRLFAASALAPGRPVSDDRQVPRADVAFHPDPVAGMPGNALLAREADAGDTGFGQSWHLVGVPASGRRQRHSWAVPAKTCGQAAVTLTWMPGRRARRSGGQLGASWNHAGADPTATAPSSAAHALPVRPARLMQSG